MYHTICFLGGESLALGSDFSHPSEDVHEARREIQGDEDGPGKVPLKRLDGHDLDQAQDDGPA